MRQVAHRWLLASLFASSLAWADELPQRVISLDYCADQYVLRLLPRERVLAVSPDATKPFSFMREQAVDYPTVRSTAEDVLVLQPDVVVRSYGGGPQATAFLRRAGIGVVQVPTANDIAGVRSALQTVAAALGAAEVGAGILADFDARLDALETAANAGKRALYMTPTGVTSGPGTLIHETLLAAGFDNFAERPGWQTLPLERLAREQPDVIAGAFFDTRGSHRGLWSAMQHPVARRQMIEQPTAQLQGAWIACGGWFLIDAIEALADVLAEPVTK